MASEILYSSSSDGRLAEVLSADMQLVLADRFSLWGSPAIHYAGSASMSGSTVVKVPIVSANGVDRMAAVAENAATANTALTLASATVTIARQALQRQISDLNEMVDSVGINSQLLLNDMVGAAAMRFQELLANITDDFTSTVGSTGVDLSADDWFSAQFALTQASVSGNTRLALLYPTQVTDLQNSARSEAGAFQYRQDVSSFLEPKGQGEMGTFLGTPILASSLVPTANAGADSAGGIWGFGAVTYADGTPAPIRGAGEVVYPAGQKLMVEFERDSAGALTKIVGSYYVGVSILQDAMGVSVITDR